MPQPWEQLEARHPGRVYDGRLHKHVEEELDGPDVATEHVDVRHEIEVNQLVQEATQERYRQQEVQAAQQVLAEAAG